MTARSGLHSKSVPIVATRPSPGPYAMDAESLFTTLMPLPESTLALGLAGLGLLLALLALVVGRRYRQRCQESLDYTRQRLDIIWRDMDELRVEHFNGGAHPAAEMPPQDSDRLAIEKAAYDQLWPLICDLHEKLGTFLRAAEAGENASDSRLQARNAALEARTTLNQVRPFCYAHVDDLATRLIDQEIQAHLAGCQHQDLRNENGRQVESEREQLHQKFRMLYDGDCRELLTQLIEVIRSRMVRTTEKMPG